MEEPIYVEEAYSLQAKEVLSKLSTSKNGLSDEEVKRRQEIYPSNELVGKEPVTFFAIFKNQFKDILIIILLIAAVVSVLISGEFTDAIVISIILLINAIFGARQEYKADKAIQALQGMTAHNCEVIRNGSVQEIPTKELVPGDIIRVNAGTIIPADARVVEAINLKTVEAPLTGESTEVRKFSKQTFKLGTGVPERTNMLFKGTHISSGRGIAVVATTGMKTEFGQIADLVSGLADEKTPIQEKLEELGVQLGKVTIAISIGVIILGTLAGGKLEDMFLLGVSLAVAAIPEGLPIVVTLAMALGVQKMVSRNAIVRRLPAVEALGAASVICTDKTGTLTLNKMSVRKVSIFDSKLEISIIDPLAKNENNGNTMIHLYRSGVLCNNAKLRFENDEIIEIGDPTEIALLRIAHELDYDLDKMSQTFLLRDELPFDSERKRMTTVHENTEKSEFLSYTKGAPDILLDMCESYLVGEKIYPLTDDIKSKIALTITEMAGDALRVLAFAYKPMDKSTPVWNILEMEKGLVFVGLMGLIDPPKPEVFEAVQMCKSAGVSIKMVTGDHKITAAAIGRELGISQNTDEVVTGSELDEFSDDELKEKVNSYSIFARISPAHKLRIIQAIKANGQIAAMTGDGVNDAPALKAADIGIAMGIQGTDVTKETSDIVLADDNFATIVGAIEEGRAVYQSMGKFLKYMLSSNSAEIFVIVTAILMGLPPPFVPIQILWINLVTDGLPALALGVDPPEPGLMDLPPRDPNEHIMSNKMFKFIIKVGLYVTVICIAVYGSTIGLFTDSTFDPNNIPQDKQIYATTMTFATLSIIQLFNAFGCRSDRVSVLGKEFIANKPLIYAALVSAFAQVFVIQGDSWISSIVGFDFVFFTDIFEVVALSLMDWVVILVLSSSIIFYEEIWKWFERRKPTNTMSAVST